MRVVMCALAKNEHLYINEWVKHYLDLGVDKIFLFDNDDKDSKSIKDFIDEEYLKKMRIINARGLHWKNMQHDLYTNFYKVERDNFDWCIFCDIDEFLVGVDNIKDFLNDKKFKNIPQIRIKWKLFGDDNLITRDTYKVHGEFVEEVKETLCNDLVKKNNLLS